MRITVKMGDVTINFEEADKGVGNPEYIGNPSLTYKLIANVVEKAKELNDSQYQPTSQ